MKRMLSFLLCFVMSFTHIPANATANSDGMILTDAEEEKQYILAETFPADELINRYGKTNKAQVRFRKGASTSSKLLNELKKGTYVYLIRNITNDYDECWSEIELDGERGYIKSEYIDVFNSQKDSDAYGYLLDYPANPYTWDDIEKNEIKEDESISQQKENYLHVSMDLSDNKLEKPGEITISISVTNESDYEAPSEVTLYYPDGKQVEEFGAPVLHSGETKTWSGVWNVSKTELDEGRLSFKIRYMSYDDNNELKWKITKFSKYIGYSEIEPKHNTEYSPAPEPTLTPELISKSTPLNQTIPESTPSFTTAEAPGVFIFKTSIQWGDTEEYVRSIEGKPNTTGKVDGKKAKYLVYNTRAMDLDMTLEYYFSENRLYKIRYISNETHLRASDYFADYMNLVDALTKKYGEPAINRDYWKDESKKEHFEGNKELALAAGELVCFAWWILRDATLITVNMGAENGIITTDIDYGGLWYNPIDETNYSDEI